MTDPNYSSILALRAQPSAELISLAASFDCAALEAPPDGFHSTGTPRPLIKTQLLVRRPTYTRRQLLPSNFTAWLVRTQPSISEATTLPLIDLLSMLESEQPEGVRFIAVCKNSTRDKHVLTVLDLRAERFYRATSATGMSTFLKGLAKRLPHMMLLDALDSF